MGSFESLQKNIRLPRVVDDVDDDAKMHIPSAFSIMRGCLPSMTATAEFVVPKSIPMTWPLTFSSEYFRTNDALRGDLNVEARKAVDARGKSYKGDRVSMRLRIEAFGSGGHLHFSITVTTTCLKMWEERRIREKGVWME
jgi:hypothetical protein